MTKTEILDKCSRNGEERTLMARVLDRAEAARRKSIPSYSGFLSPEEQERVKTVLSYASEETTFYGGYEYAERKVCVFLPDWMEEIPEDDECPLACIRARFPAGQGLTHRDFLGSLMGIGLTREKIGDIIPAEDTCDVLVLRDVLGIVLSQWESAGRQHLSVSEVPVPEVLFSEPKVKAIKDTLASLRLDSAVSSAFSISRSRAADLINAGRVSLNHSECTKTDRAVSEGDIITCRGHGKAVVKEAGGVSKKGRIIVTFERYI